MKRQLLQTLMSKYCIKDHSNGDTDSVMWEVENNVVTVRAVPSDKSVLVKLSVTDGEFSILNGYELGVHRTSQFLKLLNILGEDIKLKLNSFNNRGISLEMSDDSTNVKYALADPNAIKKVPKKANLPDTFDIYFDIDGEFITKFIKAKSSIPTIHPFSVQTSDAGCVITLGITDVNSDTISFTIPNVKYTESINPIKFDGFYLKQILNINKEMVGEIKVSSKGLMVVTYKSEDTTVEYFLLQVV